MMPTTFCASVQLGSIRLLTLRGQRHGRNDQNPHDKQPVHKFPRDPYVECPFPGGGKSSDSRHGSPLSNDARHHRRDNGGTSTVPIFNLLKANNSSSNFLADHPAFIFPVVGHSRDDVPTVVQAGGGHPGSQSQPPHRIPPRCYLAVVSEHLSRDPKRRFGLLPVA